MLKWIFSVLICMLLALSVLFGKLVIDSDMNTEEKVSMEQPSHHLQLIVQDTEEYFWKLFQEGASDAGKDFNVYVEFVAVAQRNPQELRKAVDIGVYAKVDGFGLQAADSDQTLEMINKAKEQGIAVVTYENDNFIIPNTPIVGTNSYSLGYLAGEMAVKASKSKANVAVIINNPGNQGDPQYNNNIVQGINDYFSSYGSINIVSIYPINADLFEAEKVANSIIDDSNEVDLIICLDERSTPGIAQILVDNNKVGDIKLIGYGIMPLTADYIKRGVIYGTICPNAYEIGYTTVQQLTQSLYGQQISDNTSTELYIINAENVDDYSKDLK